MLSLLPMKKRIVLESHPDFACNTWPLYEEMLKRGYNEKYEIVWAIKKPEKAFKVKNDKNVRCVEVLPVGKLRRWKWRFFLARSCALVYSNRFLIKYNKKQFSMYMTHGSQIKHTRGIHEMGDKGDWCMYQAEMFREVTAYEVNCPVESMVCFGSPRNDYFFRQSDSINRLIPDKGDKKVIIWLPTFRQQANDRPGSKCTEHVFPFGLPIIEKNEDFDALNDILVENDTILLFKPHPSQDISYLKTRELSNFVVIDDQMLFDLDIHLYELMQQTDAMITDYSSVYFDYLLADKPIGLTIDDLEDFTAVRGFAHEDIGPLLVGDNIANMEDMGKFIAQVRIGEDPMLEKRKAVKDRTNKYQDGHSSERVCDFIEKWLNENIQ